MRRVENNIQSFTVAIADADRDRRLGFERPLKGEIGIVLLTNGASNEVGNDHAFVRRRPKSRTDATAYENEVARIKLLNPLVLVVNLNHCADEDFAFLLSLRRVCPDARMILLADNSIHESQILRVLQIGARGYLKYEDVQLHLPMAIRVVGRGEAWVPRKMLGSIIDHMLNQ
jgi:DNA-binding NarL/FixJ family response regulator